MLKILSRITPPTKGKITLRGRVASLLEVGTGFHPELTGRENVYFNGAILGMKRSEIKRKFDEIVAFAGVEKFIDTPLKHYSSGMQLRLAFAVAAFLEAEILVVDEVLAVGDAEFQKKCLGKMEDVAKNEGRTVLFVSHNMGYIENFCSKSILLDNGIMKGFNKTSAIIKNYLEEAHLSNSFVSKPIKNKAYRFEFTNISVNKNKLIFEGDAIEIEINFTIYEKIKNMILGIAICDYKDNVVLETRSYHDYSNLYFSDGKYTAIIKLDILLRANFYYLRIGALSNNELVEYIPYACNFNVNLNTKNKTEFWIIEKEGYLISNSKWVIIKN